MSLDNDPQPRWLLDDPWFADALLMTRALYPEARIPETAMPDATVIPPLTPLRRAAIEEAKIATDLALLVSAARQALIYIMGQPPRLDANGKVIYGRTEEEQRVIAELRAALDRVGEHP